MSSLLFFRKKAICLIHISSLWKRDTFTNFHPSHLSAVPRYLTVDHRCWKSDIGTYVALWHTNDTYVTHACFTSRDHLNCSVNMGVEPCFGMRELNGRWLLCGLCLFLPKLSSYHFYYAVTDLKLTKRFSNPAHAFWSLCELPQGGSVILYCQSYCSVGVWK